MALESHTGYVLYLQTPYATIAEIEKYWIIPWEQFLWNRNNTDATFSFSGCEMLDEIDFPDDSWKTILFSHDNDIFVLNMKCVETLEKVHA